MSHRRLQQENLRNPVVYPVEACSAQARKMTESLPELLKALDIAGCVLTIDAMGCQKSIATQIIEQQGEYVLALKSNQETLYEDVRSVFDQLITTNDPALDYYETYETNRGRTERRRHWTTAKLDTVRTRGHWRKLETVGMVEAERSVNGDTTTERRYYILSGSSNAKQFGHAVRSHWEIENVVHWVLDMTFQEDACRIRLEHGPENFAVLRHIALNLLQQETTFRGSIRSKRHRAGWNDNYLAKVLNSAL